MSPPEEFTTADALISVLTTPDDEKNVPEVLRELVETVSIIGKQLEIQNKILLKILSSMNMGPAAQSV
jgi:uncharacterized spore protein YtfJ